MPDMPQSVSKGPILQRLDEMSRDDRTGLQALLGDLKAAGENADIVAIGTNHRILVTEVERKHLREDWFTNWWPGQPVQKIVARGLIAAIEKAIEKGLPLDCYWICSTGHMDPSMPHHPPQGQDGPVEVNIAWSKQQVTVMFHTPGSGDSAVAVPDDQLVEEEDIECVALTPNGIQLARARRRASEPVLV